jgi:hypothetical protein
MAAVSGGPAGSINDRLEIELEDLPAFGRSGRLVLAQWPVPMFRPDVSALPFGCGTRAIS